MQDRSRRERAEVHEVKVTSAPAIVTLEVTLSQNGDAAARPIVVGPWKLRREKNVGSELK
jgi:hypothetical protein